MEQLSPDALSQSVWKPSESSDDAVLQPVTSAKEITFITFRIKKKTRKQDKTRVEDFKPKMYSQWKDESAQ